jgi:hypothetical protein
MFPSKYLQRKGKKNHILSVAGPSGREKLPVDRLTIIKRFVARNSPPVMDGTYPLCSPRRY